jgi:hypothetical protein
MLLDGSSLLHQTELHISGMANANLFIAGIA